jgi:molybdate transport system substrate-binding protein
MGDSPEAIPTRLARGESADVVIMDGQAATSSRKGVARAETKVELARSQVGMVVRRARPSRHRHGRGVRRARSSARSRSPIRTAAAAPTCRPSSFRSSGIADQIAGKSRKVRGPPSGEPVAPWWRAARRRSASSR